MTRAVVASISAACASARAVVAHELLGDVDDPPGVHDEVRRVQDPACCEHPVGTDHTELVVGGTDDGAALQMRDGLVVEHVAESARSEDVARHDECGVDPDPHDTQLAGQCFGPRFEEVRHDDLGALGDEQAREVRSDVSRSLHDHATRPQ